MTLVADMILSGVLRDASGKPLHYNESTGEISGADPLYAFIILGKLPGR